VILLAVIPAGGAVAICLILPHTPVVVLVVVLYVLAAGAAGLWWIAATAEADGAAEQHPESPPSAS
jgi:hypothetical protein